MSNIVILGVYYPHDMKLAIRKKMQEIELEKEVKVTSITSIAESCEINPSHMPFLRIYVSPLDDGSHKSELNTIINALKKLNLGLDVETIVLNSSIPKEEMV